MGWRNIIMNFKTDILEIFSKQWALLTAGNKEKFNTMTVSWGGMGTLWNKPVVTVYIRPERYTREFIESSEYFTLSFLPEKYRDDLKILGSKSGRDCDKLSMTSLTAKPVENTMGIEQAEKTILCRKLYKQDFCADNIPEEAKKFYEKEQLHTMYIAEIISIIE